MGNPDLGRLSFTALSFAIFIVSSACNNAVTVGTADGGLDADVDADEADVSDGRAPFTFRASLDVTEVMEGQTLAVTFTATGTRAAATRVSLAVESPSDVSLDEDAVTIPAGAAPFSKTLHLVAIDDDLAEGNETVALTVGPFTSDDVTIASTARLRLSFEILDDDTAGVAFAPITETLIEGASPITASLVLTSQPTGPVTVALAPDLVARVALTPPEVSFTAASWNVPQTVSIAAVDDHVPHANQTLTLTATTTSAVDPRFVGLTDTVTFALTDTDAPGIAFSTPRSSVSEERGVARFSLVLATKPSADVRIDVTSADESKVTPLDGAFVHVGVVSKTFTAENWSTPQTVVVQCLPDAATSTAGADVLAAVNVGASSGSGYESVAVVTRALDCGHREPTKLMSWDGLTLLTHDSTLPSPTAHNIVTFINAGSGLGAEDMIPDILRNRGAPTPTGMRLDLETVAGASVRPSCRPMCAFIDMAGGSTRVRRSGNARSLVEDADGFAEISFNDTIEVAYRRASGDTSNLYVKNVNRPVELVSVPPGAPWTAPFLECRHPEIVGFRFVAFECDVGTTPVSTQIFLRDRRTGVTELISHGPDGALIVGNSRDPSIDASGRYIAFVSDASLVPSDTQTDSPDIYIHDRANDTYRRFEIPESLHYAGNLELAFRNAGHPVSRITWDTNAQGVRQIAVLDPFNGYFAQASWAAVGVSGRSPANLTCHQSRIEPSGQYVFASCSSTNLVDLDGDLEADDDTNGVFDIYRFPLP